MSTRWERIARESVSVDYAATYAERFRTMAARGQDIHGEATFVSSLLAAPGRVLDAGCGTGRIAVRLAELGYDVVGLDVDASMLAVAAAESPGLDWRLGDLASFDLGEHFDLVLLAGNILPLLEPGTLGAASERLSAHTAPGGHVVCGFGLDAAHLPAGCPVTSLAEVDAAMSGAGLESGPRFGTWDSGAFAGTDGYVVSMYTQPKAPR